MKKNTFFISLILVFFISQKINAKDLWIYNPNIYKDTGIENFHKAGYTGKNVNVGNYERAIYNHSFFNGKVIDIQKRNLDTRIGNSHGNRTALILHSVVPDSNIFLLDTTNVNDDLFITEVVDIIKKYNILVTNGSKDFADNKLRREAMYDLMANYNHKSIMSTGNLGEVGGFGGIGGMWKVGALNSGGYIEGYSGYGSGYGFMAYCVYYLPSFKDDGYVVISSGTSFSSPLFAGMVALVDDFFIENTGQPLTNTSMKLFIEDNTKRINEIYGMFVLPEPQTIDIDKYINIDSREV